MRCTVAMVAFSVSLGSTPAFAQRAGDRFPPSPWWKHLAVCKRGASHTGRRMLGANRSASPAWWSRRARPFLRSRATCWLGPTAPPVSQCAARHRSVLTSGRIRRGWTVSDKAMSWWRPTIPAWGVMACIVSCRRGYRAFGARRHPRREVDPGCGGGQSLRRLGRVPGRPRLALDRTDRARLCARVATGRRRRRSPANRFGPERADDAEQDGWGDAHRLHRLQLVEPL